MSINEGRGTRLMTVGELSRRTGVPIKSLRAYTDLGLICSQGRSPANYRLYDDHALWCVHRIGTLRGLGLTVAEIRDLTTASREDDNVTASPASPRFTQFLARSRARLEQRIAAQQRMLRRIEEYQAAHQEETAACDIC
ncbi:MerR family transcriptional regulator [Streptomyces sp. CNQ-509]|uniref:MerR family transcriptional regulator n=1 Tax=Streptomyces sp. CNQ-509 TaxID=444103 RepID=UPI000A8E66B2|nr:MerR family transcriptional regulator [Streptomyces sp. CNQ-509]